MKSLTRSLLTVLLAGLACHAALADEATDLLTASQKALSDAPAWRLKAVATDLNNKQDNTITLESVGHDQLHMRMEQAGALKMEMVTDGTKSYVRQTEGKYQEAPPAVASVITNLRKNFAMEAVMDKARDVKVAGHENVNGKPATVLTFTMDVSGLHATTKMWVSDQDHRPIKAEGESHGEIKAGGATAGRKTDVQTAITYDYDPSIKVVLPTS